MPFESEKRKKPRSTEREFKEYVPKYHYRFTPRPIVEIPMVFPVRKDGKMIEIDDISTVNGRESALKKWGRK